MKRVTIAMLNIFLIPCFLLARQIDTFYGSFEVTEPVLLELIDSEAMQRLKDIHQYGVAYYTTHKEEYSRYDHSLGVFVILREQGVSLKEQIAGLLHDVSHTVFSHVGDWIFGAEYQEKDYQNQIHVQFLQERGIEAILKKYGYKVEEIQPTQELFPALECSLPDLCADRIDYNIQGAYHQGFLTYEEAFAIFKDLKYTNGIWTASNPDLMKKLVRFSLFMSEDCWGSPQNFFLSRSLADAILHACNLGILSDNEIHFGTDNVVWKLLKEHPDPFIQEKMDFLSRIEEVCVITSAQNAEHVIKSKFRGINPLIRTSQGVFPLSRLDPEIAEEFCSVKLRHETGWPVKLRK